MLEQTAIIERNAKSPEVKKEKTKKKRQIKSVSPKKLKKAIIDKENSPEVSPAAARFFSPLKPSASKVAQGLKLIQCEDVNHMQAFNFESPDTKPLRQMREISIGLNDV